MANPSTPHPSPPISILFVCLGNICRSPMAEATFRSLTSSPPHPHPHPQISHLDSAGTGAYHTSAPPDPRTMRTLAKHGIVDYRHQARKIQKGDFEKFDYVLAMDGENLRDLERLRGRVVREGKREKERAKERRVQGGDGRGTDNADADTECEEQETHDNEQPEPKNKSAKIMLFGDFTPHKGEEVIDPYYGADNGFEVAYEQMVRFSKGFLREVLGVDEEGG